MGPCVARVVELYWNSSTTSYHAMLIFSPISMDFLLSSFSFSVVFVSFSCWLLLGFVFDFFSPEETVGGLGEAGREEIKPKEKKKKTENWSAPLARSFFIWWLIIGIDSSHVRICDWRNGWRFCGVGKWPRTLPWQRAHQLWRSTKGSSTFDVVISTGKCSRRFLQALQMHLFTCNNFVDVSVGATFYQGPVNCLLPLSIASACRVMTFCRNRSPISATAAVRWGSPPNAATRTQFQWLIWNEKRRK